MTISNGYYIYTKIQLI